MQKIIPILSIGNKHYVEQLKKNYNWRIHSNAKSTVLDQTVKIYTKKKDVEVPKVKLLEYLVILNT